MNLVEEDKIFVEMEYVEEDFFLIYQNQFLFD